MFTQVHHAPNTGQREIVRLVRAVGEHGEADYYAGKRQARRASNAIRLEVTTDPDNPSASHAVMLHNISLSGLAFWSKRRFLIKSPLFVREFSNDERPWVGIRVQHCTFGIRGFLTGTEFDVATEDEGETSPMSEAEQTRRRRRKTWKTRRTGAGRMSTSRSPR